jgi:hypothetical protein
MKFSVAVASLLAGSAAAWTMSTGELYYEFWKLGASLPYNKRGYFAREDSPRLLFHKHTLVVMLLTVICIPTESGLF